MVAGFNKTKGSDFLIRLWPYRGTTPAKAQHNAFGRCSPPIGPTPPQRSSAESTGDGLLQHCSDSSTIWYWQPLQFPSFCCSCKYKFHISKSWQNETWGIGKMGSVYELWSCPWQEKALSLGIQQLNYPHVVCIFMDTVITIVEYDLTLKGML